MLYRDAGEQLGDLVHLGFSHAEARELLRPQAHAARLHGRRVPGQEVLVRDDVRLLQVRRELRATAEGRHVEGDRVALRESMFLGEDPDPPWRGSWNCPPAMRPSTWAPSYQTVQPASWNASRKSAKGVGNRKTLCPNAATFGFTSLISVAVPSTSMFIRSTSNG